MVLESTMICLDNSDWMRNGDYLPSRLEAQQDAAGLISNDRICGNPENTVGILTMAGKGVDLLVSPTEDSGKVLACFSRITLGGRPNLSTAVQIAQLALKHRKNKNGSQRIIVFVGSPIAEDIVTLQKIGKQLKKNNVAVDVISMGEIDDNNEKLVDFVNATNSSDNSHLIVVPAGVLPADAISSTPVMHGGSIAALTGAAGPGAFDEYGGIDPSMDPELAMAIRVSTEEARAREEARAQAAVEESGSQVPASASVTAASNSDVGEDDEETLMQRALELSMQEMSTSDGAAGNATAAAAGVAAPSSSTAQEQEDPVTSSTSPALYDDDEDEALRLALALSMGSSDDAVAADSPAPLTADPLTGDAGSTAAFLDAAFVSQLLGSVDVDQNDPLIQAALAQLQGQGSSSEGNDEGEKKESRKRKGDDEN